MNASGKIEKKAIVALALLAGVICLVFYWRVGSEQTPGDFHVRKGNYRLEDGQYEKAIAEFSKALEKNPNHPWAHLGIAITNMQMDRIEEALAAFQQLLEIDPDNAVAHTNLGILYDQMGRYEDAIISYKNAIHLDREILDGPGWLWRFMHNVSEKPPTIAERAAYLEAELQKPPEQRVLRIPEKDQEQRMYKVD